MVDFQMIHISFIKVSRKKGTQYTLIESYLIDIPQLSIWTNWGF